MKKILLAAAVMMVVIAMAGSLVMAGGTNSLTVSATVLGTCNFSAPTSTLSFGTLDPNSTAPATASATPTFWCSRGTTLTSVITNTGMNYSGTSKRMLSAANPGEYIPYSLSLTPGSTIGAGRGTPITLTVAGTVLNTDFINALAASDYSDTVLITIAP